MNQYLQSILKEYSTAEILQVCKAINKEYNIYDPEDVRWNKLAYALYKTKHTEIEHLRSSCLSNEVVNALIFNYYYCERVIKYHFIKHLKNRMDHIVAFEMAIGDSRVDICRINGSSYAYEIKTEYDTFDRLETQMRDYTKTFEKVYVIVPCNRVADVRLHIPDSCGVISYRIDKNMEVIFSYVKKAYKNSCDIELCINSLSSNDMSYLLKLLKRNDCKTRDEKRISLLQLANSKSIWKCYRQLLRHKYEAQWKFITNHFDEILPIDIQSFFSSNMNPQLLYSK